MRLSSLFVAVSVLVVSYFLRNGKYTPRERERTLVIVKPDGIRLNLVPIIDSILEVELGLARIHHKDTVNASKEVLIKHYAEHAHRSFFDSMMSFMQSGPLAVSVWEGGPGTIQAVRRVVGATDPSEALPWTIRGRFGSSKQANIIHASDGIRSAEREISVWFS